MNSVVIGVYRLNKAGRDPQRMYWQCLSLRTADEVIIVDGSKFAERTQLRGLLKKFSNVRFVAHQQDEFNLCALYNRGIQEAKGDYIQISGADFMYSPDYFDKVANSGFEFTMSEVGMLPRMGITARMVEDWTFKNHRPNNWGDYANGIQYASKEFFKANPYNEDMPKLGAQDNFMYYQAKNAGLTTGWLRGPEVLHIDHSVSGYKFDKQFEANQRTLNRYVKENGLRADLKK